MASLNYWDGTAWKPISAGGGGGVPGPAGADGKSVNVFGPQVSQPIPERKGDMWLAELAVRQEAPEAVSLDFLSQPSAASLSPAPEYEVVYLTDSPSPSPYAALKE